MLEGSLAELTGEHVNSSGSGSDTGASRDESPRVALLPEGGNNPDRDSVREQEALNVKCSANIRLECDEEPSPTANDDGDWREAAGTGEHVDGDADDGNGALEESGRSTATPFVDGLEINLPPTASHECRRDPDVGDGGGHDPGLDYGVPVPGVERQRQPDVPGDALAGGEVQLDLFAPHDLEPQPESISAGGPAPDAQDDTTWSSDETG